MMIQPPPQARALRNHPLHFRVKRLACECLVALVSGGTGSWRFAARDLVRRANVTATAAAGLDAGSHFVGSRRQARREPCAIDPGSLT
jgi:hypothetical protein